MPKRRSDPPARDYLGARGKLADRLEPRGFRRSRRRSEAPRFGLESLLPFEGENAFESGAGIGTHWIEIRLIGEDGEPVPGVRYEIVDPDGQRRRGMLDDEGCARVERIRSAGQCKVRFPDLDREAWEAA